MSDKPQRIIGWREWLAIDELGIPRIKAKVDTGARTSALHAFYVEPEQRDEALWVRFGVHPLQKNQIEVIHCQAPVIDQRVVSDSGGHREARYVIQSQVTLGKYSWPVELTLTNRDTMQFRMLLGRSALDGHFLVDVSRSYLLSGKLRHPQP
ncbi:MAG: ATP-dependent zinc protease [Gammaproteobacteria bacterium]|jgi:hypothetical protein